LGQHRFRFGRLPIASLFGLCLLAACGGSSDDDASPPTTTPPPPGGTDGGGSPPAAPAIALAAAPGAQTVILGGDAEITVTLTRSGGASGDVTLSAAGLPAGVTATFDPPVLGAGATTSKLTVSADKGAAEGAATVTISGASGELAATASVALTVASLTVTGKVTAFLGDPLAAVGVLVGDEPAVTSGPDGSFTVHGVAVPYDVTAFDVPSKTAVKYVGLTTAKPVLTVPNFGASQTGALDGTFSTGAIDSGQRIRVCLEGKTQQVLECETANAGESGYQMPAVTWWGGGATADVHVRAIGYTAGPDGNPIDFTGLGEADATVAQGTTVVRDLTMGAAPAKTTISATLNAPLGSTLGAVALSVMIDPKHAFPIATLATAPIAPSFAAPDVPGATYVVFATAASAGGDSYLAWDVGLTAGATATPAFRQAPVLLSPAAAATGVTAATKFEVSNPSGGVLTFEFAPISTGPTFYVVTKETSVTIPDLTSVGLALPAAASYHWTSSSFSLTDLDSAATEYGPFRMRLAALVGTRAGAPPPDDGSIASAKLQDMTTQ
jgi:hypothetical protein